MNTSKSFLNVVDCCTKHTQGQLNPRRQPDVIAQLYVEGHKRLEAFLFEPYLSRAVTACCGIENTALGWSFQFDDQNKPQYWFKLLQEPDTSLNKCDHEIMKFLIRNGCDVIASKYDVPTQFFKSCIWLREEKKWSEQTSLTEVLQTLLRIDRPRAVPKNFTTINADHQKAAIEVIDQTFSDDELYNLSVSRLLVNCYLFPWFNKQPMDIDVCCIVNGQIKMIEFKRKYPAGNGTFGIDQHPHGMLIDWLSKNGQNLTHLLLCDPLWDKNASAIHLLEPDSLTAPFAYWLGAELNTENTQGHTHRTSGSDSGFTGGERTQRVLPLHLFSLVGKGLHPQLLCDYLLSGSLAVTQDMLSQARDAARSQRRMH